MLIGLKGDNYYSKVFIRVNYKLSNITFWVVITLIEPNHKLGENEEEKMVCWPDIANVISVVSLFVHAPYKSHIFMLFRKLLDTWKKH